MKTSLVFFIGSGTGGEVTRTLADLCLCTSGLGCVWDSEGNGENPALKQVVNAGLLNRTTH